MVSDMAQLGDTTNPGRAPAQRAARLPRERLGLPRERAQAKQRREATFERKIQLADLLT